MASLAQHKADTLKWLGQDCEEVHKWVDEYYASRGPLHRRFRHHEEGIEEAGELFGERGREAAIVHVLRDCRNIPRAHDYVDGTVDPLGLRKQWPIAAYSLYTEEAFAALVQFKLHGPTGLLLWSFAGLELAPILPTLTKLSPDDVNEKLDSWSKAIQKRNELSPLPDFEGDIVPFEEPLRAYSENLTKTSAIASMAGIIQGKPRFGWIPIEKLITPLALIDYEYIEELRPELQGDDDLAVAKFALPESLNVPVKGGFDAANRSVSLVSRQKTLLVTNASLTQTPLGLEVRFLVASGATMIAVSKIGNRVYLRTGIHRAFLLASMGRTTIPCVMVDENQLNPIAGSYPSFSPTALLQPRPPLLTDFFDDSLTLTVPLQRTHKVIRISAEDFLVPVD